jgi:Gylcosyl hydrolase family 115 C-terminal domain
LLGAGTFSLVDYGEAERVGADWRGIAGEAEDIGRRWAKNETVSFYGSDAFFELVLYPVKACEQLNELYIDVAKNHLYASQGRASANDFAADAKRLFRADADLSAYYNHTLAGGKWDHMMDQTHIGYTSWQQPATNVMPEVIELEIPEKAGMGVAIEGSTNAWPACPGEAVLPELDRFNRQSRYFDIFNTGKTPFAFSATGSVPWIQLSDGQGTVEKEKRIWVSVNWRLAPAGLASGTVKISGPGANDVLLKVNAFNPAEPDLGSWKGFVEADGYVSMEAEHYSGKMDAPNARWEKIDDLGRTLSAMSVFPVTAESVQPPENSPCLMYHLYLYDHGPAEVEVILSPTLNFVPGRGLRFGISFDDQPPQIVDALGQNSLSDWATSVKDGVRKVKVSFELAKSGEHTLKFWMVDPGVVLQKIVVDMGGVKPSYFGPPESFHE